MTSDIGGGRLGELFERAIAEGWCLKINCATCGNGQFREGLGQSWQTMKPDDARSLVLGLRELGSGQAVEGEYESAVRWLLYEIWRCDREVADRELFPLLEGTGAEVVLKRMRAHYQRRQEIRRAGYRPSMIARTEQGGK